MNCTPFVRQYGILDNKWGLYYAKKKTKQTIHTSIKKMVIETMQKKKLGYSETARRFEVNSHSRIQD